MIKPFLAVLIFTIFCTSCTKKEDDFQSTGSGQGGESSDYLTDSFVKSNLIQDSWTEVNIYYTSANGFYNTNSDPNWSGNNISFSPTHMNWTGNLTLAEGYALYNLVLDPFTSPSNYTVHMTEDGGTMYLTHTIVNYQAFTHAVSEYHRN